MKVNPSSGDALEPLIERGLTVLDAADIAPLVRVREAFMERVGSLGYEFESFRGLRRRLSNLSQPELNDLKAVAMPDLSVALVEAFREPITRLCGGRIFLQRRPNINFNVPGRDGSVTRSHTDMLMGHSPYTFTLWVPLHDIEDGSGLCWLDQPNSMRFLADRDAFNEPYDEKDFWAKAEDWLRMKFGQGLLFNGFVLHGAQPNLSEYTRIALDVRVQSIHKPLYQKNMEYFVVHEMGSAMEPAK